MLSNNTTSLVVCHRKPMIHRTLPCLRYIFQVYRSQLIFCCIVTCYVTSMAVPVQPVLDYGVVFKWRLILHSQL